MKWNLNEQRFAAKKELETATALGDTGAAAPQQTMQNPAAAPQRSMVGITDTASAVAALQGANYQKSQAVMNAEQALIDWQNSKPADYQSSYSQQISGLVDKILNRGSFAYDPMNDPVYQNYKQTYAQKAQQAQHNAQAMAAVMSGGYGSSYGASAGAQAYANTWGGMADVLASREAAALNRYQAEGDQLAGQLAAVESAEQEEYAKHRDAVDDYYRQLNVLTDRADTAYNRDYTDYQNYQNNLTQMRDFYAGQDQQAVENEMAERRYQEAVRQWEAEQAAAAEQRRLEQQRWEAQLAMEQQQWEAEQAQWMKNYEESVRQFNAQMAESKRKTNLQYGSSGTSGAAKSTITAPYSTAQKQANATAQVMANSGKSATAIVSSLRAQGYNNANIEVALKNVK